MDIKHLIHLNLEIEGLLKILDERDSEHARTLVAEKFVQYSNLMHEFLGINRGAGVPAGTDSVDSHYVEVKDQEAEEPEVVDEDDAAAAAIARGDRSADLRGGTIVEPASAPTQTTSVLKAFTLNDKFYFIREVFGGNEEDFNETLKVLDSIDNFAEAEEYIYDDMMLDRENADVKKFMDVIKRAYPA